MSVRSARRSIDPALRFTPCLIALALFFPAATGAQTRAAASDTHSRLDSLRERLPRFREQIEALRDQGQDVAYPMVSYTVLEDFTKYAAADLQIMVPDGWGFVPVNGCQAEFEIERKQTHSGQMAVKLTNKTPLTPNVYGMLESTNGITLKQGQPYTLSAWARTDDENTTALVAGGSWQIRLAVPDTGNQWQRISLTFTPGPNDTSFSPRVVVQEVTDGIWLDDIQLVEGEKMDVGKNLVTNGDFEASWTHRRAEREVAEMQQIAARLENQLEQATAGTITLPAVPRWTGQKRPRVQGSSFVGPVRLSPADDGKFAERPIFFIGYGHFSQARKDIEKFPDYGINIIQGGEWGPSAIYPAEGKFDDTMIRQTLDALDRGAKAGVAYDLLISPHYFPDWMFQKYPHLRKVRTDFFPFSLYAPEGRDLLKKFIREALPPFKDKPALLSVCLTNEPINQEEPSDFSRQSWHDWLRQRYHGEVAEINRRWKSQYKAIDDIPQPNPLDASSPKYPSPIWWEFARFNGEFFADFHKMLADAVHEVLPGVPVHAKGTTWHYWRTLPNTLSGLDPLLMGRATDLNGNDSVNLYGFGKSAPANAPVERGSQDFAQGWIENALGYDLQRAGHDAPVFNSENHFVFDGDTRPVPGEHFRAALWQGAVHGQSATTLWVWERTTDPRHPFAGNVMDRPICVEATGIACLDLNRVAREMTAIQNIPPAVQVLHCPTSAIWDGPAYEDALVKTYTALSFTGAKFGFITERQLEEGQAPRAGVLFVPNVSHISDAAFKTLAKYDGRLVLVGDGAMQKNEYDADRPKMPPGETERLPFDAGKTRWQDLWSSLPEKLQGWGVKPKVLAVEADGKTSDGVQSLTATTDSGLIVNLYNVRPDPQAIALKADGTKTMRDLLTGESLKVGETLELQPMEVRLFRLQ